MAELFNIGLETGDFSEFTSTTDVHGHMHVEAVAAMRGTTRGMECNILDVTVMHGTKSFAQVNSGSLRFRFFIDPNGLTMANGDKFIVCSLHESLNQRLVVELHYLTVSGYDMRVGWVQDSGLFDYTSYHAIADTAHCVEILVTKASTADANDGTLRFWIDGTEEEAWVNTKDCYNRFAFDVARLGAVTGVDVGTSGELYLDELVLRNDSTQIGCADATTTTTTTTTTTSTTTTSTTTTTTTSTTTTSTTTTSTTSTTTTSTTTTSTTSTTTTSTTTTSTTTVSTTSTTSTSTTSTTTILVPLECAFGFQARTPSIQISGSLIGTDDGSSEMFQRQVSAYSHTIQADGGYDTVTITINASKVTIEDWLARGLGRHVAVYNEALEICWEGFVNQIQANVGGLSKTVGPLNATANRATLYYSDETTNAQGITAVGNNADSQAVYGIWHKVLSGGECSAANALGQRDTYLSDNAWPPKTERVGVGGSLSMTLNCAGYKALLDYPYAKAGVPWTIRAKLIDIMASEPNAVFSTDYSGVEANGLAVPRTEDKNRTGEALVKTLVALGSSVNLRCNWGVYAGRRLVYNTIPSTVEYLIYLSQGVQRIMTVGGVLVQPWNILPGKWAQFVDLLPNQAPAAALRQDARLMFIESVTYNAPYDVTLQGGKTDRLPQLLAKMAMLKGI